MPCKIKVKVIAGRNLPVMDRAGDTTDAFVEIKFGGVTHKTDVCRKSLNPHWSSTEWYRFEVDESELQDEPLQLRLMDHDTYSANDAIGKVVVSLAPLLAREQAQNIKATAGQPGAMLSGWIPVFDTMHGIRGELNIIVKVELFSDFNKYKTSSCGVQFFHCPKIPPGYRCSAIHGFVEELVVNDDPEYQWIDKIRTPRASNEARQVAFIKLSNQVQRLVGLKAAELGANAVVGYLQDFDLEGEAGVVARAIGTAVSITPVPPPSLTLMMPPCSQHQLKKVLDILTPDRESLTDLNEYFNKHQDELQKLIHILHPNVSPMYMDEAETAEDDKYLLSRQASIKSYAENVSIYQDDYPSQQSLKTISDDQTDLNRLLNKIDDDSDNESQTPLQKLKKITPFLNRFSLRKKPKSTEKSDDQISVKSFSSDTSKISLTDIKKEITKFKRLKKPKFRKRYVGAEDEGEGMVSILARSVIHAHTSLACIAEKDSENSPNSTMRRVSESEPGISELVQTEPVKEPTLNIKDSKAKSSESSSSLKQLTKKDRDLERKSSESCPSSPVSKRVDNLLKLPGDIGYFGSVSSALSGESSEVYSSSDEEDESSDLKTDTDKSIETTSSIVQTVLGNEVDPALIAHMDMKLSVLESNTPEPDVIEHTNTDSDVTVLDKSDIEGGINTKDKETHKSTADIPIKTKKSHSFHHFKFHNPFTHSKSISAPSSPNERKSIVYRSSKTLKDKITKISKSNLMKGLSHYSLSHKKKETAPIRRNSHSDAPSKTPSHQTVLGSPFLSYTDLLSLDKDEHETHEHKPEETQQQTGNVKMYIGSEPVSRASISGPSSPSYKDDHHHDFRFHRKEKHEVKPTGLIHTAIETILIDKVQSLLLPTSPEPQSQEKKFFEDVNEKLEIIEESRKTETIEDRHKKLVRQNSIHSIESGSNSRKMSCDQVVQPPPPMLQHFHPLLSGVHLETIPSLPESFSLDTTQSIDKDGVIDDTNGVVCDNSHGVDVTDVGRSDKDKERDRDRKSPTHARHESCGSKEQQPASLNATSAPVGMNRRSSDSDLSITPKGGSLTASVTAGSGGGAILRASMNSNNLDMLEYPFLTMTEFPAGFVVHLGGGVCARCVKLADVAGGGERAAWWAEIRTEIRAHARALRCNAVIGYTETATICEDICVLSASGTAAVINLDCDLNSELDVSIAAQSSGKVLSEETVDVDYCCMAHVPYSPGLGPYRAELSACGTCRRSRVPTVLLASCEKPNKLVSCSKAITLTAVAGRVRRAGPTSEPGARDISDQLPFLEYELHKLLLAKLRMQGANALFNLRTEVSVGERYVVSLATGTAHRLAALPAPHPPRIKAPDNDKEALELQKKLWDTFTANKTANGFDTLPGLVELCGVSETEEEGPSLDLCGDRDACLLELDEAEDVETARSLCVRRSGIPVLTTQLDIKPLEPAHAFIQVYRCRLMGPGSGSGSVSVTCAAEKIVSRTMDLVSYKLRRLRPAALALPAFQIDLTEDEIQMVISGAAIPLVDFSKPEPEVKTSKPIPKPRYYDFEDDIFSMDDEYRQPAIEDKPSVEEKQERTGLLVPSMIALTSQSEVVGARSVRRICALRLLFVRETTAVRELGGLSGFIHTFTCEVLAIVRAYTAALGGNTLTSFYIRQLMLQDNAHKNQCQCLVSVGGDVIDIIY